MSFQPYKLGRYTVLNFVAAGGMAEIFQACLTNVKNASNRVLIIKKVHSCYSKNVEFIRMFEEEIKITVGLTHPNIMQIYDYFRMDGNSFLVIEYIEGKNLRELLQHLASKSLILPVDISCYIICQVCQALQYAHSYDDRLTGKPLNVVHRDVSPQNIMISYDGAVKLFDFGVAKARNSSEATQAGVIKGKPAYLSPEQIAGKKLDRRSDIFSLGVVFWEMLTSRRLFAAENDLMVLNKIKSGVVKPPSSYNKAVLKSLDMIVLKALNKDLDGRYQEASEFQRNLHKFLYSFSPSFNPADLSYYISQLFEKEILADRKQLQDQLRLVAEDTPPDDFEEKQGDATFVSSTQFSSSFLEEVVDSEEKKWEDELGIGFGAEPSTDSSLEKKEKEKEPNPLPSSPRPSFKLMSGINRYGNRVERQRAKPERQSKGRSGLLVLVACFFVLITVFFFKFEGFESLKEVLLKSVLRSVDSKVSELATLDRVNIRELAKINETDKGSILFKSNVREFNMFLNGERIAVVANIPVTISAEGSLDIKLKKYGYKPQLHSLDVKKKETYTLEVNFEKMDVGKLNFFTNLGADITLTSKDFPEKVIQLYTPIIDKKLPVGEYDVLIENVTIQHRSKMSISIKKDEPLTINKDIDKNI